MVSKENLQSRKLKILRDLLSSNGFREKKKINLGTWRCERLKFLQENRDNLNALKRRGILKEIFEL